MSEDREHEAPPASQNTIHVHILSYLPPEVVRGVYIFTGGRIVCHHVFLKVNLPFL